MIWVLSLGRLRINFFTIGIGLLLLLPVIIPIVQSPKGGEMLRSIGYASILVDEAQYDDSVPEGAKKAREELVKQAGTEPWLLQLAKAPDQIAFIRIACGLCLFFMGFRMVGKT